ncbi:MAG: putative lipoprotein LppC [Candidatus Anoxychlamydiales bacterium]|nr:putative lipoprotein LppC [Candidatus Anoxychlamydiales bacterium]NGX40752.1 putative lipoprotein LppC [Candidatus Anoxychlamydiales bacterium]HEU64947.1 YbhB/YbcL family Raf kinase inhibitor-like protein [Chlamydiota bacterium]
MKITSVFKNNEMIPKKFTCQGEDINPKFVFEDIPKEAKSLSLIMDDPDAPNQTFVHWVMYNIPIVDKIDEDSALGIEGINSAGSVGYFGPCPPTGTHRYFFKLYAIDSTLDLKKGASKEELEITMKGHIIEKAQLIGLYVKN